MNELESNPELNGEQPASSVEAKPEKPWRFKKGQSGNPGGKPKAGNDKPGPGVPLLLRDMRWVYAHAEGKEKTEGQRQCREWFKEDRKGFLAQLSQLEKAQLARSAKTGGSPSEEKAQAQPEEVDEGTDRVVNLVDRWLVDFHAEQAKEDAELAARPNAAEFAATLQNRLAGALDREERLRKRVDELAHKSGASASG